MAIAAGDFHSVALKNDGTLVAWGDYTSGQTNIPSFSTNNPFKQIPGEGLDLFTAEHISETNVPMVPIRLLAAGGDHSIVAIFSSLIQYPVDVSKDLLLIYNTNSPGSSNVCAYYLANRPMVGSANVLGIGCVTNSDDGFLLGFAPGIDTNYFRTNMFAQIQTWLNCNPTKRPSYAVLFQDIPSAINFGGHNSVQYELNRIGLAPWNLLVTSINMNGIVGDPTDCIAYIDKLANMATNNPPGTLFISATAANYGNNNWYFGDLATYTTNLIAAVTPGDPSAFIYTTNTPSFFAQATNVAGYYDCGWDCNAIVNFPIGEVQFFGNSGWYVMATTDSYNGERFPPNYNTNQTSFIEWFAEHICSWHSQRRYLRPKLFRCGRTGVILSGDHRRKLHCVPAIGRKSSNPWATRKCLN